MNYFLYFIIYGFLGFLIEVAYRSYCAKKLVIPGFLVGPILPIYGFGAFFFILIMESIYVNPLVMFFVCIVVGTLFEYITAILLEQIMGVRLWDYSEDKFNYKGRISLVFSIAWGFLGLIVIYGIQPTISYVVSIFLNSSYNYLSYIVLILLLIDASYSIYNGLELKKKLSSILILEKKLEEATHNLKNNIEEKFHGDLQDIFNKIKVDFENQKQLFRVKRSRYLKFNTLKGSKKFKDIIDKLKNH